MSEPLQALQEHFGFSGFREGQQPVIEALLEGKNAAAVFPTGAGKSLCYQLPALLLDGVTLVVSPLLALMKDQVDSLQDKGIEAARLDSSLSAQEYAEVLSRARSGALKLLYVAPERFNNERFRQSLGRLKVSLFAIDEAHCVSEWGHNFRPDYLKLTRYAEFCRAERVLALTATATPAVLDDIVASFAVDTAVRTSFHRPNLVLKSTVVESRKAKLEALAEALEPHRGSSAIVYVTLQRTAEEVAASLAMRGFHCRAYHAGMDSEVRADTQASFQNESGCVIVATIAFGMGIDKPDIRAVLHYDPPKSLENYSQEIGRAGRDGQTSVCHLFYYPPDRIPLENFVYGDTPSEQSIKSLLEELFGQGEELTLKLNELCDRHDLRTLVLRTLLTYLELDGNLQALTPIYASYRFKPSAPSRTILADYQGEEQRFLANILKHSTKKRVWFTLEIEEVCEALGVGRGQVVAALEECSQRDWMELQATQLRFRYRVLKRPDSIPRLASLLYEKACRRELAEIGRLQQVEQLATSSSCMSRRLAAHFGEELEADCGVCGACTGERTGPPALAHHAELASLPSAPPGLTEPRALARFFCGITSPSLRRAKLTRHATFGALSEVPFPLVLEAARSQG